MNLVEKTPPTPHVRSHSGPLATVVAVLVRLMWGWRFELVVFLVALALWNALSSALPTILAVLVMAAMVATLMIVPRTRAVLIEQVYRASLRRRWTRGCRHARLETFNGRVPRIVRHRTVGAGDQLRIRVPAGGTVTMLEDQAETIAAFLGVRDLRVMRDPDSARYAACTIVRRDPLAGTVALPWPHLDAERLSLREPIPVGVDEDGEPTTLTLPERNVLIGGEPGAGKSVAESMILATAALDPECELTLLDGKQVELAVWRHVADTFVGPNLGEAIDVLRGLQAEMDRRYAYLLQTGRRKVERGDGLPLHVVDCDELAYYLTIDDRNGVKLFASLFRDLVSRGRAAGIIAVAATQKPSGDIVPTSLRDLFGFRWALRCNTRDASDTILGAGWATNGYSADDVAGDQRGVGYLLAEGLMPERLRSYYLSDEDLAGIAERALHLRAAYAELSRPGLVIVR